MSDEIKITQLADLTAPARGDYLYIIDDPAGNPASRRANIEAVLGGTMGIIVAAAAAPDDWKKAASYVCDGTNDEVQIQAAIDALDATYGGKVILSPGLFTVAKAGSTSGSSYNMGYCVLIDENDGPVTLEGQGIGSTIIKLADDQVYPCATILIRGTDDTTGKRTSPTTIRGIEIDGNAANQTWAGGEGSLIQLAYANYVTIDAAYLHDAFNMGCQVLRNSLNFLATKCRYNVNHASMTAGQRIESPKAKTESCDFEGSNDLTGVPLVIVTNQDIGVQSSDVKIVGSNFDGGRTQAAVAGNRITFMGCSFINSTYSSGNCIQVSSTTSGGTDYNCDDLKIVGCSFQNIRQGIILDATGTAKIRRAKIDNNTLIEGPTIGLANGIIVSNAGVENTQITENTFYSATTAITDNGTDTVKTGNVEL